MKRRKLVGVVTGMILLSLGALSCKSEELRVYKHPDWDAAEYFDYSAEVYEYKLKKKDGEVSAPQTRTVQFMGKTYDATYSETYTKEFFPYADDYYESGDFEFSFVEHTDKLSGVTCFGDAVIAVDGVEQQPETEADYRAVADRIAGEYIVVEDFEVKCTSAVNLFQLVNGVASGGSESFGYFYEAKEDTREVKYTFTYSGKFQGYDTCENVIVTLDRAGNLCGLQLNAVGLFADKTEKVAKPEEITALVKKTMESACLESYAVNEVSCDITLGVNGEGEYLYLVIAEAEMEKQGVANSGTTIDIFVIEG